MPWPPCATLSWMFTTSGRLATSSVCSSPRRIAAVISFDVGRPSRRWRRSACRWR
jgi:hypothetical protein